MTMALLLLLLVSATLLCRPAQSQVLQAPRFSRLSSCLENPDRKTNCVVCGAQVTVDADVGRDCSGTGRSLVGITCSRLEDVIESIAVGETRRDGCVAVLVEPRPGNEAHVVFAREDRVLTQNLVMQGTSQVSS